MPLLPYYIWLALGGLGGAYVGSQIDDAIDTPPVYVGDQSLDISPTRVLMYAAIGLGMVYAAKRLKVI